MGEKGRSNEGNGWSTTVFVMKKLEPRYICTSTIGPRHISFRHDISRARRSTRVS